MATLASTRNSDIELFKFLYPKAYPKKAHLGKKISFMVNDGVIAIETLFERALAIQGKLTRNSVYGEDFTDGSDAKKCCAYISSMTKYGKLANGTKKKYTWKGYIARVGKFSNKNGVLRVLVHEPLHNHFYFLKIPNQAYRGIKTITLPFNKQTGEFMNTKWARYRVLSFKELAS